ncbi:MAG: hypothetical protein IKZ82_14070 [Clostridia bacterium]|nr:hypothetical protein [Clostridia bacterium]
MNKKEFKHAMLCGLGRCVLACRNEPERYRAEVLWGCTHQLAYDAQCEGSRAWFLHELVSCYPDTAPFRDALIASLGRKNTWGGLRSQIDELLLYMADCGDGIAEKAIWDDYAQIYSLLRARKRRQNYYYFYQLDDFLSLAIDLCRNEDDTLRILSDIGRLILENPIYDALDFEQLHWHLADSRRAAVLRGYAKQDEYIAHFFAELERMKKEREALYEASSARNGQSKPRSAYLFSKKADAEVFRLRAENYLNETDLEKRAELLRAFIWRPFPFEPDPIINDASSAHEALRDAAWDALGLIRSPKVREFALSELEAEADKLIPLLIMNYEDSDEPLLGKMLERVLCDKARDDIIHSIVLTLNNQRDAGFKIPAWILLWFYDNNRCSCCRENIVRELGRRRLLMDELLRECLYDANDDIRKYAEKKLEKRAAAGHEKNKNRLL